MKRNLLVTCLIVGSARCVLAQVSPTETAQQKLQRLSDAVVQVQSQVTAYQKQLQFLQEQLAELQSQLDAKPEAKPSSSPADTSTSASLGELRERQAIAESQIATHEQAKVESESKYPLRVSGLILFNAFINTRRVDDPIDPTYALNGSGTTGMSIRQTILGLQATGPHLLGATSHADLNIDFFGNGSQQTYGGSGLVRLRTAHASLRWKSTEAFFSLDRPLLAPNMPTSLVSTAQPNLAWSGDLWTWNPQAGVKQEIAIRTNQHLQLEGAVIDVQDPRLPNSTATASFSLAQRSRWPGLESRLGYAMGDRDTGFRVGVGQYFSPHRTLEGYRFNAWAASADLRLPLGRHVQITSNAYRGAGLGGLGGGGYVDYVYPINAADTARPLNNAGGWVQASIRRNDRLQFNGGFGIDAPFAADVRSASSSQAASYPGLTRNRAAYGNVIVSPSSYLQLSLEYRRLWSNYLVGPTRTSDAIGVAAGYRF
ncbi:hypothetical protein [Terriglobus roseus]|uniref:Porin n=1 Tax=Terriglobus roseus TaxID=392734 RepID=A0A1H4NUV4_9BACT|nr:hypothetical protein [Terriglobus roseus]SEB98919.1 hypothetical protein SAMN05443244_2361 [Terriglobus roseus]